MIPILLVSDDEKKTQKYLNELQRAQAVENAYVFSFRKDGTQLKIEQIREIRSQTRLLSSARILVAIYDFETAKTDSQNALLKTLEESGDHTQFVLITSDESTVLPTIVSRTKLVRLQRRELQSMEFDFDIDLVELLDTYNGMQKNTAKAVGLCDSMLGYFQRELREKSKKKETGAQTSKIINEILKTRILIDKNNLNPQLGIDHLLIKIRGTSN